MKKTLIALTILASALTGAQAGIILNDTFDYNADPTPVDIVGAPGSAWVANSGATSVQVATNSLIVTSLRAQDVYRPWQSGQTAYMTNSAAVLYSSYTLHCTFLPNTGWNLLLPLRRDELFYQQHRHHHWSSLSGLCQPDQWCRTSLQAKDNGI